jgi:hypothetical protein
MKHWTILLVLGMALHLQGACCDLCNMYMGLNPQYNNNQVGIRLRLRTAAGLHSHTHTEGSSGTHDHAGQMVHDTYLSSEAYGRFYWNPKWVTFVTVPYAVNVQRDAQGDAAVVNGIGDVPLLLQRQVFNLSQKDSNSVGQRLFAGAGLKLPLGRFDLERNDDPHLQAGSGSWDGLLVAAYLAQWRKFGLAADLNFRISTANRVGYRFANRFNATASLYYSLQARDWTLMPMLGAYAEAAGQDLHSGIYQIHTGGFAGFVTSGFEAYHKRLGIQLGAQVPAVQALNGDQPANQLRLMTAVGVAF